jgi:hypothetical protein
MRFYWQVPASSESIANRSLVHEKHPGINGRDAMWSLGMDGGAARRNWAILVGDSAGGGVEKEEELTLNRFVASDGGENAGGWPAGGAQGARPRRPSVRRRSGLGGDTVGAGRMGRPCGTARRHWTAANCARGGGCSGAGARAGRRRAAVCRSNGAQPVRLCPLLGFKGRRGDGTRLQCHGTATTSPCVHARPAMDQWSPRSGTTR